MEGGGSQNGNSLGQASRLPAKRFSASYFPLRRFIADGLAIGWARRRSALLLVAIFSFAISAMAQVYSINWHKIAGGGGTSTEGVYAVSDTIGQHDATANSALTGGNYSLRGGFWGLISTMQTPGAPTLYISHSGTTVMVFWQDVSGWHLQQNNDLTLPAGWSDSSGAAITDGTNYLYIISPHGSLFFRLSNGQM